MAVFMARQHARPWRMIALSWRRSARSPCVLVLLFSLLLAACAPQTAEPTNPPKSNQTPSTQSLPQAPGLAPASVDYIRVNKSARELMLFSAGKHIKTIEGLQFGDSPQGHKQFEGDERTPEGRYYIDARNPQSSYHLSLRISYPNQRDINNAALYGRSPGGDIFIHGQPNELPMGRMLGDWTDGCIALSNEQIEELWQLVPNGAVIDIYP